MALLISTTGVNVVIPELGITLLHPLVDFDMASQFTAEEIRGASSLTTAIVSGALLWRISLAEAIRDGNRYDSDYELAVQLTTGSSAELFNRFNNLNEAYVNNEVDLVVNAELQLDAEAKFTVLEVGGLSMQTYTGSVKVAGDGEFTIDNSSGAEVLP